MFAYYTGIIFVSFYKIVMTNLAEGQKYIVRILFLFDGYSGLRIRIQMAAWKGHHA